MLEAAKKEYFALQLRVKMQHTMYQNEEAWIAAYRNGLDTSEYEQNYEKMQAELEQLTAAENAARKARVRIGHWSVSLDEAPFTQLVAQDVADTDQDLLAQHNVICKHEC